MTSPAAKAAEILVSDPNFISDLEKTMKEVMADDKIDLKDLPKLILIIMKAYNSSSKFELTYDELPELIGCVSEHILNKYKMVPEDQIDEYNQLIEYGIELVLMRPRVKNCMKKTFNCLPCCK